ncbi:hypothetical protein T02_12540, partial [Trichinella nativa]
LRYANNDRHKRCLIVSKGALVRLTYVASGSVGKCCLTIKRGRHEPNHGPHEAEQEMRRGEINEAKQNKAKVKLRTTQTKSRTARSRTRDETRAFLNFQISNSNMRRRVLTNAFLLFILELIVSKKFHCTKTGFQRCAMQITIAIKESNCIRKFCCVKDQVLH